LLKQQLSNFEELNMVSGMKRVISSLFLSTLLLSCTQGSAKVQNPHLVQPVLEEVNISEKSINKIDELTPCQKPQAKSVTMFATAHGKLSNYDRNQLAQTVKDLQSIGFTKIAISSQFRNRILGSGNRIFKPFLKSNRNIAKEIKDSSGNKICVAYFMESGLQVVTNKSIPQKWLLANKTGTYSFKNHGLEHGYVNFLNPEVQAMYIKMYKEVAATEGVDEIVIDDHWSLHNKFGYSKELLALYAKSGGKGIPEPEDVLFKTVRQNAISRFTKTIIKEAKKSNPHIRFTVISLDPAFMLREYNQPIDQLLQAGIEGKGVQAYIQTVEGLNSYTKNYTGIKANNSSVLTLYIGSGHDKISITDIAQVIANIDKTQNRHIAIFGLTALEDPIHGKYRSTVLGKVLKKWN
jgi:Glycosyl hydrolase-like 10